MASDRPDIQAGLDTFKRFCEDFRAAHSNFLTYLQDITSLTDKERFVSLLLNRLIFLYFLQKHGLLANDPNYLSAQLKRLQQLRGQDLFLSFYHYLLLHLFQCEPPTSDLDELFDAIPRFNVALFDLDPAEESIQIPDTAFEQLFACFDAYQWQIDAQPSHNAVTPALLSSIFERCIDQKQMGAYYTKEDVSAYIGKNTIIAYILHTMQQACVQDFRPDGPIWQLVRSNPDRYISTAIRHASCLPTETEREYAQRSKRYADLKTLLTSGMIVSINDFITYNLDIAHFSQDIIDTTHNPVLLCKLYECLTSVSILDPTCGSGAFLFAALHILTPLYAACLERMRQMLTCNDLHRPLFHKILKQADLYADPTAFILKTIIANNLYGVDIMSDAVEICKLRLFLTLVARLQHPDEMALAPALTFNIRSGNTLVGFVYAQEVANQTALHNSPSHMGQQAQLDAYLASTYANEHSPVAIQQWRESHRPFHWFLEFHEIMQRGGFDVIIGNPPYVEYSKVRQIYKVQGYETETCGNLYAAVIERSLALCRPESGFLGYIVPLSICSSERFHQLRHIIMQHTSAHWLANFEIFPCRLFDGAFQRLSILLARHANTPDNTIFATKIQRWYASERPHLIDLISYTRAQCSIKPHVIPKLAAPLQEHILQKVLHKTRGQTIATVLSTQHTDHFVYYQEATNYWTKAVSCIPYYRKNGVMMPPPHGRFLYFADAPTAHTTMAIMNSSLFYVWFATFSDGFHLSHTLVKDFPVNNRLYQEKGLLLLAQALEQSIKTHARISTRNTRADARPDKARLFIELEEYRMSHSKPLIDEIDALLARHYDLTSEELDFIIYYDHKYRMGKDDGEIA